MRTRLLFVLSILCCLCAAAFGSEEGSGDVSLFSGSLADAVWTMLVFVGLLFLLWKVAWKPMLAGLQAREDHIQSEIDEAEATSKESQKVLVDYQAKLAKVDKEGERMLASYVRRGEQHEREHTTKTREQVEAMKVKADIDIARARSQAELELLDGAGELIVRLGEEILSKSMNDEDNRRLIAEAVERLKLDRTNKSN